VWCPSITTAMPARISVVWILLTRIVAVLSTQNKTNHVSIWQVQTKTVSSVDTKETKGLTFLAWSTVGANLAIGSARVSLSTHPTIVFLSTWMLHCGEVHSSW
jgi:hypothetical protein